MARKVWVVLQVREDKLHRMAKEAIAAAQQVAALDGGSVEAVLLGSEVGNVAAEAAGYDLAGVHCLEHEALSSYTPGAYVAALKAAFGTGSPDVVLFPHSYQTVDYMARLAQESESALVPEVTGFDTGDDGGIVWQRPILSGKLNARVRVQTDQRILVSVQSGVFSATAAATGSAGTSTLSVDLSDVAMDREILGVEEVAGEMVDLSAAEIVVAAGRGVGGEDKMGVIRDLAEALGGEIGASRPVIDNGWLPRDRQIGSSGQTVTPKLYIAVGISGAIQHLVGMKGSQTVVAINKDPGAPIFSVANFGVVGDLHEILPALTAAILEAKAAD